MHHTLMDGEYDHFGRRFAEVTVARATLTAQNAPAEIDRVLNALRRHRKPVHLNLPTDIVLARVPEPAAPLAAADAPTDPALLGAFRDAAARMLAGARTVTVLAGHEADRHGLRAQLAELLAAAPVRAAVYSTGKGLVDEGAPGWSSRTTTATPSSAPSTVPPRRTTTSPPGTTPRYRPRSAPATAASPGA
ncbi:hypothetical protein [Streptomyces noursei]|uniref:hypothetical protein n=1 Tax=Streptomyces noursei TaxID=1971 RepID=UPI00196477B8|nr:hypothetical protein [Streptomyces noursei]QRX95268.1 hypothetical protein JNO44_34655 [Streptomyces noursei]